MNVEVRNNPAHFRYELFADGKPAGYIQYGLAHGRIALVHTEVEEPYEGLGTHLARGCACQGTYGNALLPVHR